MRTRLRKIWDSLRATYWFVPSFMMVLAIVLWLITNKLDQQLSAAGNKPLGWLYFADIESTRKLLFTIAGTVIGIVGVVFSILMVPLTIAATQFGPRLLRTFLRDTGTNVTLGTFTATFVFCVLVLLQLHEDKNWPLPQISVSTGLALGLLSFGMLVFFINHIATSIQASVLISEVNKELMMAIDHELPKLQEPVAAAVPPQKKDPVIVGTGQPVLARNSGYVHTRDDERLLRFAKEHDIVIKLLSRPGDFVVEDTPLALVFSNTEVPSDIDLEEPLNEAFTLGLQRTLVQDVIFGINELVEVAARALSPGINDPFTAMTCLDWLGTALCRMCSRTFPDPEQFDDQGSLRLITNPITFTAVTDAAFNPIRDYGRSSTIVILRLLDTIATVAHCIRTDEQRMVLLKHAKLVEQSCKIGLPETADRAAVAFRLRRVMALLQPEKELE